MESRVLLAESRNGTVHSAFGPISSLECPFYSFFGLGHLSFSNRQMTSNPGIIIIYQNFLGRKPVNGQVETFLSLTDGRNSKEKEEFLTSCVSRACAPEVELVGLIRLL